MALRVRVRQRDHARRVLRERRRLIADATGASSTAVIDNVATALFDTRVLAVTV